MSRVLKFQDFAADIDYDALYADLGWEPKESSGAEDKGYCLDPWRHHKNGDTTGKLAINREKGVYNCWVCGGGTLITLVGAVKNISDEEAAEFLWKLSKTSALDSQGFLEKVSKMLASEEKEVKPSPKFNESVMNRWKDNSHPWFAERGISEEVRKYFFLGFDGNCRTFVKDQGAYEGPGIVLPHFWMGRLVGWQTRWLDGDRPKWIPKYSNTTDFPREETLWGYDLARTQREPTILVESVPSALFLISEGSSAMATFGSQITPSQLRYLRSFQNGIRLAPDNDEAGQLWLHRAGGYLRRYINVWQIPPVKGEGADLGDLSPEELVTHLEGAKPYGF